MKGSLYRDLRREWTIVRWSAFAWFWLRRGLLRFGWSCEAIGAALAVAWREPGRAWRRTRVAVGVWFAARVSWPEPVRRWRGRIVTSIRSVSEDDSKWLLPACTGILGILLLILLFLTASPTAPEAAASEEQVTFEPPELEVPPEAVPIRDVWSEPETPVVRPAEATVVFEPPREVDPKPEPAAGPEFEPFPDDPNVEIEKPLGNTMPEEVADPFDDLEPLPPLDSEPEPLPGPEEGPDPFAAPFPPAEGVSEPEPADVELMVERAEPVAGWQPSTLTEPAVFASSSANGDGESVVARLFEEGWQRFHVRETRAETEAASVVATVQNYAAASAVVTHVASSEAPTPTETPTAIEQAPVPDPVDPNPVDPNPVDPNPVDPNPVDPNPVESEPVEQDSVSVNVTVQESAAVGDRIPVTLTVTNNGFDAVSGHVVQIDLPAEMRHRLGRKLDYDVPSIAAGAAHTTTFRVTATETGTGTVSVRLEGASDARRTVLVDVRSNAKSPVRVARDDCRCW